MHFDKLTFHLDILSYFKESVFLLGFPGGSMVKKKKSACQAGDTSLIPVSERSPEEGNGNPLQYSYLENPMDGGAWQATVCKVMKSQIQFSD